MYRIFLLGVLCLAGCRSSPPPQDPKSVVSVNVPGVHVNVRETNHQPTVDVDTSRMR